MCLWMCSEPLHFYFFVCFNFGGLILVIDLCVILDYKPTSRVQLTVRKSTLIVIYSKIKNIDIHVYLPCPIDPVGDLI